MAYLTDYRRVCEWPHCATAVSQVLHDRWNGVLGYFCAVHARARLKEQLRIERGAGEDDHV